MRNPYLFFCLYLFTIVSLTYMGKQIAPELPALPTRKVLPAPKVIALVKYRNVIFRCHKVKVKSCGYTLKCDGNLDVTCEEIEKIQWL